MLSINKVSPLTISGDEIIPEEVCILNRHGLKPNSTTLVIGRTKHIVRFRKVSATSFANWQLLIFFYKLPPGLPPKLEKSWEMIFNFIGIDTNVFQVKLWRHSLKTFFSLQIDQLDYMPYMGSNFLANSESNSTYDFHQWHHSAWVLAFYDVVYRLYRS